MKPIFVVDVRENSALWVFEDHFKSIHLQLSLEIRRQDGFKVFPEHVLTKKLEIVNVKASYWIPRDILGIVRIIEHRIQFVRKVCFVFKIHSLQR